ncbi:hypothetical protein PO124_26830 [Bacillus licheniformis]|nr:hypothetical protein [Bacillus licheniformis]
MKYETQCRFMTIDELSKEWNIPLDKQSSTDNTESGLFPAKGSTC